MVVLPRPIDISEDKADQDVRLMQLVANQDARARAMLAQRLCARVRRLQRALLGDPHDSDDAAQDALVEILRAAGSYRGEASLERWADRIAVRTGLRFRRRRHRDPTGTPVADTDALAGEEAWSELDALPRPLLRYLDELPAKERRVLVLKHALGYSLPEIAELVGAPRSTTKYRLGNALRRIRRAIKRDTAIGTGGER